MTRTVRKRVVLSTLWAGWGLFGLSLFAPSGPAESNFFDVFFFFIYDIAYSVKTVEGWILILLALTNVCMYMTAVAYWFTLPRLLRFLLYSMPIATAGICIFGLTAGSAVRYGFYMWSASFALVSVALFLDRKSF